MVLSKRSRSLILASVGLSVAVLGVTAAGVGPALLASLGMPMDGTTMEARIIGGVPAGVQSGPALEPSTAAKMVRLDDDELSLEEKRARWFELVYQGQKFEAELPWEPTHP
jgi:hypothetical protein